MNNTANLVPRKALSLEMIFDNEGQFTLLFNPSVVLAEADGPALFTEVFKGFSGAKDILGADVSAQTMTDFLKQLEALQQGKVAITMCKTQKRSSFN